MYCAHCGALQTELPLGKLPFRAACEKCGSPLHTCTHCRYYKPGQANDCLVPGTDPVRDRTAMNFCEEFALNPLPPSPQVKASPRRFDDLFK